MNRRLILVYIVAAVGLTLAAFWVASFFHGSSLTFGSLRQYALVSDRGTFQFRATTETEFGQDRNGSMVVVNKTRGRGGPFLYRLRMSQLRFMPGTLVVDKALTLPDRSILHYGYHLDVWSIPAWAPACVLVTLLFFELRAWRRDHMQQLSGLCRGCGYDLRASPQRCPECGAAQLDSPVENRLGRGDRE